MINLDHADPHAKRWRASWEAFIDWKARNEERFEEIDDGTIGWPDANDHVKRLLNQMLTNSAGKGDMETCDALSDALAQITRTPFVAPPSDSIKSSMRFLKKMDLKDRHAISRWAELWIKALSKAG